MVETGNDRYGKSRRLLEAYSGPYLGSSKFGIKDGGVKGIVAVATKSIAPGEAKKQ